MSAFRSLSLLIPLLGVPACGSDGGPGPPSPAGSLDQAGAVAVGADTTRTYVVHVPGGLTENVPPPLVLAFHGSGSSGAGLRDLSGLNGLADELGMVVAYPDALEGNWAEDCGCNVADRLGINDTAFVSVLVDSMVSRHGVDRGEVHAVGFSQGGLFVQRLACQMADRLRTASVVAATFSVPLSQRCAPAAPPRVLMVLGTADPFFPWPGTDDGALSLLGAQEAGTLWAGLGGCGSSPAVEDEAGVTRWRWMGCDPGARVRLVGIDGAGHAFRPGGFPTLAELREWMGG